MFYNFLFKNNFCDILSKNNIKLENLRTEELFFFNGIDKIESISKNVNQYSLSIDLDKLYNCFEKYGESILNNNESFNNYIIHIHPDYTMPSKEDIRIFEGLSVIEDIYISKFNPNNTIFHNENSINNEIFKSTNLRDCLIISLEELKNIKSYDFLESSFSFRENHLGFNDFFDWKHQFYSTHDYIVNNHYDNNEIKKMLKIGISNYNIFYNVLKMFYDVPLLNELNDKIQFYRYNDNLITKDMINIMIDRDYDTDTILVDRQGIEKTVWDKIGNDALQKLLGNNTFDANIISKEINVFNDLQNYDYAINSKRVLVKEYIENNIKDIIDNLKSDDTKICINGINIKPYMLNQKMPEYEMSKDYLKLFSNMINQAISNVEIKINHNIVEDFILHSFHNSESKEMVKEIKNENNNETLENENNKIGKYFIVDLEQSKVIDISMNSEKGEYKIDFEKFISVLAEAGDFKLGNKYSNNLLIVKEIQGALDDIEFTNNEITVLNSIYNIGKIQCIEDSGHYDENSSAIKDTILINTKLEKTSNGEYDYNNLLKKECYSYNYNKELNVDKHIRRLKTNIALIPKYGNGDIEVNTKNEVKNNQVLK